MKKTSLVFLLSIGLISLMCFQSFTTEEEEEDPPVNVYEQFPPMVDSFWVQKLEDTLPDGSNMRVMIKYQKDGIMTDTINIFYGDNEMTTFRDDGTVADATADDSIYSAYIKEDITLFTQSMHDIEDSLTAKGYYLRFTGHNGEKMTTWPAFDFGVFDAFGSVNIDDYGDPINFPYLDHCRDAILKQNSLFITEINTVEDYNGNRSFRITDDNGSATGLYTFGNMISNIVNTNSTSVSCKNFLKDWLRNWTTTQTVNGQIVEPRGKYNITNIVNYFIAPWLQRARNNQSLVVSDLSSSVDFWETLWDDVATTEANILKYAPFKLTAIVNRIDLRGNTGYVSSVNNAGETRFIFSLVAPYDYESYTKQGKPPVHQDQNTPSVNLIDWQGMNIIFEYGNVQTTTCDLRTFAQAWANLSNMTLGDVSYRNALANITKTVIDANAVPGKPNGSAINRIRTNEKILHHVAVTVAPPATPPTSDENWNNTDWEFRQFELDATTHKLKQVPLTNTPVNDANYQWNAYSTSPFGSGPIYSSSTSAGDNLIDWLFHNQLTKSMVLQGKHLLPLTYPTSSDYLLAAVGHVTGEYTHYLDLQWNRNTTHYTDNVILLNVPPYNPIEKQLRQQLSLNTCQGCHAGETKTLFTHVRPLTYNETAEYWNTPPDPANYPIPFSSTYRKLDTRFIRNAGLTATSGGNVANNPVANNPVADNQNSDYFLKVSAFLTGMNYHGAVSSGTYADDEPNDDASDNTMEGLFYVNDPANDEGLANHWTSAGDEYGTPGPHNKKWGYNDLERRKIDLCHFINRECSGSKVLAIRAQVVQRPFIGHD